MKRLLLLGTLAAATIGVTNAGTVTIRPRFTGGGNSLEGRCIVRIMVDDRAYVSMRGDTIFVESVSGRNARDDGSECTGPMPPPRAMSNFQFRGIDGRGEVRLVEDPRSGREPRVSIYDSKGGDEGYTFEWRWTATQGGNWTDGRWNDSQRGRRDNRATWSDVMQARSECESAVVNEIQRRYGTSNVRIQSMNADNNPGRNDFILGRGRARQNGVDREFSFSCRADLERGRVRDVEVHPSGNWSGNGGGDRPNRFDMGQARNTCTIAVQDDLRRRGYSNIRLTSMDLDNNPGRNDYIVGSVEATRGGFSTEQFNFNCRADFSSGRVYAVQTNRR